MKLRHCTECGADLPDNPRTTRVLCGNCIVAKYRSGASLRDLAPVANVGMQRIWQILHEMGEQPRSRGARVGRSETMA